MKQWELFNQDCYEGLKGLEADSIDLTVTSPPYDNLREYNGYSFNFEGIAKELYRVTKVGGGGSLDSFRRSRERKRNGNEFQTSSVFQRVWL